MREAVNNLKKIWQSGQLKNNADTTDEPTKNILHTVLIVADYLLQNRAILLPLASKKFISAYTKLHTSTMSHVINLDVGDITI